jgi:hypothetical protein
VEAAEGDEAHHYRPSSPSLDGECQAAQSPSLAGKPRDPVSWSAAAVELQVHKHGKDQDLEAELAAGYGVGQSLGDLVDKPWLLDWSEDLIELVELEVQSDGRVVKLRAQVQLGFQSVG